MHNICILNGRRPLASTHNILCSATVCFEISDMSRYNQRNTFENGRLFRTRDKQIDFKDNEITSDAAGDMICSTRVLKVNNSDHYNNIYTQAPILHTDETAKAISKLLPTKPWKS